MIRLKLTLTNEEKRTMTDKCTTNFGIFSIANNIGSGSGYNANDIEKVHVVKGVTGVLCLNGLKNLRLVTLAEDVELESIRCSDTVLKDLRLPLNECIERIYVNIGTNVINLDEIQRERPDIKVMMVNWGHI